MTKKERIEALTVEAKAKNLFVRVTDVKISTEGIPTEVTDEYVLFTAPAWDVIETGDISGPAKLTEKISHSCMIMLDAIIRVELSERPKK